MKAIQGIMFPPELMPDVCTPYLGVFTDQLDLTELHIRFIMEAAEEARKKLYDTKDIS